MSLSSVTIEQREKETEALKTFLFFSFIGSLVLHIGLLALAINKFFFKVPEVTNQPIELTILETIPQEAIQPPIEIKSLARINAGGSNQGGENSTATDISIIKSSVASVTKQPQRKTAVNVITKKSQISTTKPAKIPTSLETNPIENTSSEPAKIPTPIEKLVENANTQGDTKPADIPPLKSETPTNVSSQNIPSNSTTSTESPQNQVSPPGNTLSNLGDRLGNSSSKGTDVGVGNNSGNRIGNGSGVGVGNNSSNKIGNGSGIGNEIGNTPKPENTPVTTVPKPPIENSSKLNRADCIQCQINYPDKARRRGAEGNPEVAIDTDSKGNVTRVRLIRSSGDSELDEAAKQAAQEWKLTPTEAGREGVRASVNFAIKGSQRHRKLQERQIEKQREAVQTKPEKEASTSTPTESPQRSQPKTTPIITDIPSENTTRRKQESVPSERKPVSPPRQRIQPDKPKQTEETTPRRRSPEPVKSDTNNQLDEGRTERVQKSRRRLEEILRRRQKSSESPPAEAPPAPEPATTSPSESNSDSDK
jgi:TonB family protein